jgi:hypothetical protein
VDLATIPLVLGWEGEPHGGDSDSGDGSGGGGGGVVNGDSGRGGGGASDDMLRGWRRPAFIAGGAAASIAAVVSALYAARRRRRSQAAAGASKVITAGSVGGSGSGGRSSELGRQLQRSQAGHMPLPIHAQAMLQASRKHKGGGAAAKNSAVCKPSVLAGHDSKVVVMPEPADGRSQLRRRLHAIRDRFGLGSRLHGGVSPDGRPVALPRIGVAGGETVDVVLSRSLRRIRSCPGEQMSAGSVVALDGVDRRWPDNGDEIRVGSDSDIGGGGDRSGDESEGRGRRWDDIAARIRTTTHAEAVRRQEKQSTAGHADDGVVAAIAGRARRKRRSRGAAAAAAVAASPAVVEGSAVERTSPFDSGSPVVALARSDGGDGETVEMTTVPGPCASAVTNPLRAQGVPTAAVTSGCVTASAAKMVKKAKASCRAPQPLATNGSASATAAAGGSELPVRAPVDQSHALPPRDAASSPTVSAGASPPVAASGVDTPDAHGLRLRQTRRGRVVRPVVSLFGVDAAASVLARDSESGADASPTAPSP